MTKITIENEHGIYSVATHKDIDKLTCFLEMLVKPCLIASGYSKSVIDRYIIIEGNFSCYEKDI